MNNLADVSDVILNSGFESEATIKIALTQKKIKVIYVNEYMKAQLSGIEFLGGEPHVLCRTNDVKGVSANADTIKIDGENNNKFFMIREIKPNSKNLSILTLSID